MKSFLFLLLSLFLIVVTFSLDYLARHFYLYWTAEWTDTIVHFFGGLGFGLLSLWVYTFSGVSKNYSDLNTNLFFVSLISVLIIGLLWESYEYEAGITSFSIPFIFDTLSDLFMDLAGAVSAILLASLII